MLTVGIRTQLIYKEWEQKIGFLWFLPANLGDTVDSADTKRFCESTGLTSVDLELKIHKVKLYNLLKP